MVETYLQAAAQAQSKLIGLGRWVVKQVGRHWSRSASSGACWHKVRLAGGQLSNTQAAGRRATNLHLLFFVILFFFFFFFSLFPL